MKINISEQSILTLHQLPTISQRFNFYKPKSKTTCYIISLYLPFQSEIYSGFEGYAINNKLSISLPVYKEGLKGGVGWEYNKCLIHHFVNP